MKLSEITLRDVSCCLLAVCKNEKKVWCSLNYVWYIFFYIGRSFSYVPCSFWRVSEKTLFLALRNYMSDVCCLLIAHGIYVGAYCIRPVRHRSNSIANRCRNYCKPAQFGRMQYAPTEAQSFHSLLLIIYKRMTAVGLQTKTVKSKICQTATAFLYGSFLYIGN